MTVRAFVVLFLVLLALASGYVFSSSGALPALVASHFDAAGNANGYMSRDSYEVFTLVLLVALPGALVGSTYLMFRAEPGHLRLPNAEYWLAPERAQATVAFVAAHTVRLAIFLTLFIGYVHGLVVAANRAQPAHLSASAMALGLAVFLAGMVLWIGLFLHQFRQPR